MSLGPDHQWGWLCDTRKEDIESLIEVTCDNDFACSYYCNGAKYWNFLNLAFLFFYIHSIHSSRTVPTMMIMRDMITA